MLQETVNTSGTGDQMSLLARQQILARETWLTIFWGHITLWSFLWVPKKVRVLKIPPILAFPLSYLSHLFPMLLWPGEERLKQRWWPMFLSFVSCPLPGSIWFRVSWLSLHSPLWFPHFHIFPSRYLASWKLSFCVVRASPLHHESSSVVWFVQEWRLIWEPWSNSGTSHFK